MTKNKQLLIAIGLASILITGGLNMTPNAYSSRYHDDYDDDHNDVHDDKETCECEKPSVFSVIYNGPGIEDGVEGTTDEPVTIEIYKKSKNIGNSEKKLASFPSIVDGNSVVLDSSMFGKKKINSNTTYHVIQGDVSIATISIHTSCSQSLFVGDTHTDGPVTLTIEFGQDKDGEQSIFLEDDPICTKTPMKIPARITFFNSITTDNGVITPDESEFGFSITGITDAMFATTYEIEPEVPTIISLNVPTDFTRVLLTGESCPLASEFDSGLGSVEITLQQEQHLVCTVYHDDNGDGVDGAGVIFHFDTQIFEATDNGFQDSLVGTPCTDFTNPIDPISNNVDGKCVERNGSEIVVVPDLSRISQELTDTTIVMFTVIPVDADMKTVNAEFESDCIFNGLSSSVNDDNLGFRLFCSVMSDLNQGDGVQFNVNYALIETTMG